MILKKKSAKYSTAVEACFFIYFAMISNINKYHYFVLYFDVNPIKENLIQIYTLKVGK
jgi:hypothetical protein